MRTMNKHAYLIIAHTNFGQLKKLLQLLDDKRNDIYIFVDQKSFFNEREFETGCRFSPVYFTKRINVNWGGYSQICAEMSLFRDAAIHENYAYYHLLSGMDLPLHNQEYIHAFFDKYAGYEFFTFTGEEIYQRENPASRLQYYYRFQDSSCNENRKEKLLKIQNLLLLPLQRRTGVNRLKNRDLQIGYGANWVSVTNDFVKYILAHEDEIEQLYRNSFCCDEIYKHTLLINSPFKDKIFILDGVHDRPEDRQGNLRYINWWTGSPRIWKMEDQTELKRAAERGYLFSRKFDERVDSQVIDWICEQVKTEPTTDLQLHFENIE